MNARPNSRFVTAQANGTPYFSNGIYTLPTFQYETIVSTTEIPLTTSLIGEGAEITFELTPLSFFAGALLLNLQGDNKPNAHRCDEVRQRAIAVCTDLHIGTPGRRDNSGPFFACIRERMEAEGCQY